MAAQRKWSFREPIVDKQPRMRSSVIRGLKLVQSRKFVIDAVNSGTEASPSKTTISSSHQRIAIQSIFGITRGLVTQLSNQWKIILGSFTPFLVLLTRFYLFRLGFNGPAIYRHGELARLECSTRLAKLLRIRWQREPRLESY